MEGSDRALSRIAARQHGLVTGAQAAGAGLTRSGLAWRLRRGSVVRVHREVYRLESYPVSWEQRALAACLLLGPQAVLSRLSAAALWKLDLPLPDGIDVTLPHNRRTRLGDGAVIVHRTRDLAAGDRTRIGRFPVTRVQRTLVDLAGVLPVIAMTRVLDDALARRLVSPERVLLTLDRLSVGGRSGLSGLREALAPWLEDLPAESVAEIAFSRRLATAGIPAPRRQYAVRDGGGAFVGRLDFAWPEFRLGLEVDGFRWHANARSFAAEYERINRFAALGLTVLRATPAEIERSPDAVLTALRRHLLVAP
jgi:Transcriptional regulator, AbiEi antitoxin